MKIKCYLIRHGQTPANRRHSYLGWTEEALSAEGRMQILSLKEKIEKIQNCCLNHFDDYKDSLLENVSFEFFAEEDL